MSNEGRIEFDILDHEGTCVIHYKFIGNWQPADFTPAALQVWDRVKTVPTTEAIFSIMDFSLTPNFNQAGLVSEAMKAAKNPLAKRVRHTYMVGVKQKSFFESMVHLVERFTPMPMSFMDNFNDALTEIKSHP